MTPYQSNQWMNFNYPSKTRLRAAFTRTISAASTAISLPTPPMAIPTSDFLKAGASFTYLDNQMDFYIEDILIFYSLCANPIMVR